MNARMIDSGSQFAVGWRAPTSASSGGGPLACSGGMNPGEPITSPACVSAVDSTAREMPKSMTRGPPRPAARSTA